MTYKEEIWVLGRRIQNADKSFLWDEPIPSISDADVVIIDSNTLPSTQEHIASDIYEIRNELSDKISSNGTVIVIYTRNIFRLTENDPRIFTPTKNQIQSVFPCLIESVHIGKGTKLRYEKDNIFVDYLKHVKCFEYNLANVDGYELIDELAITDNSDRMLGGTFVQSHSHSEGDDPSEGELVILPSVTDISIEESIDKIISIYKKEYIESRPSWAESLKLPGLDDVTSKLNALETQRTEIVREITEKTSQREGILKFTELLSAKGAQLEKVAMESFVLLGFDEIKRERERNDEDWIIEMKFIPDVKYGVIEIKGRDKTTSQKDIVQCNKWVDDYKSMSKPVETKGIFISNQFRHDKYPDSATIRKKYEPNELRYSESREICIIPSCVLFEAIRKILGGEKPDREEIEHRLFNTNGVLEEIL